MMKDFACSWPKAQRAPKGLCLILTSRGGGGHLQAAHAKKTTLAKSLPDTKVLTVDILLDWLGPVVGKFLAGKWNSAQRRGDLLSLAFYAVGQRFIDNVLWLPVFFSALHCLLTHKIDWIIDTQNMAMPPIVKAARLVQFFTGREITYEKVITDLPTKKTTHFFNPIKRLTKKDRSFITLVTTKPLLGEGENEEEFWKKACKLPLSRVKYEELPLRYSFQQYSQFEKGKPLTLDFQVKKSEEVLLMLRATAKGSLTPQVEEHSFKITIPPETKVSILMLGSNPHEGAILDYTKLFIDLILEKKNNHRKDVLFIFCNETPERKHALMKRIVSLVESYPAYPKSLTIVPLAFQDDSVVAPLFHRSDATFTRSGGITSMEILTACKGRVWIHRGTAPKFLPKVFLNCKTIKEGMPPWERGNADYLIARKGAQFVTPTTFREVCKSYFDAPL